MRVTSGFVVAAALIALAGCATRPKPMAAACPVLDPGKEADIIFPLLQKEFGYRREGYSAIVADRQADPRGNAVLQLTGIRSATDMSDTPGDRLTVVVEKCSLKVLGARRPTA